MKVFWFIVGVIQVLVIGYLLMPHVNTVELANSVYQAVATPEIIVRQRQLQPATVQQQQPPTQQPYVAPPTATVYYPPTPAPEVEPLYTAEEAVQVWDAMAEQAVEQNVIVPGPTSVVPEVCSRLDTLSGDDKIAQTAACELIKRGVIKPKG